MYGTNCTLHTWRWCSINYNYNPLRSCRSRRLHITTSRIFKYLSIAASLAVVVTFSASTSLAPWPLFAPAFVTFGTAILHLHVHVDRRGFRHAAMSEAESHIAVRLAVQLAIHLAIRLAIIGDLSAHALCPRRRARAWP